MGDRALIILRTTGSDARHSPVLYLHWGGSCVRDILQQGCTLMADRRGDVEHAFARLTGIACETFSGRNTGVGVWNCNNPDTEETHGDAGVFIVDVSKQTWTVTCRGGYGFEHGKPHKTARIKPKPASPPRPNLTVVYTTGAPHARQGRAHLQRVP